MKNPTEMMGFVSNLRRSMLRLQRIILTATQNCFFLGDF
jgi:hypothetical protein